MNLGKVEIACIQETNNGKDDELYIAEYEIYFAKAGKITKRIKE